MVDVLLEPRSRTQVQASSPDRSEASRLRKLPEVVSAIWALGRKRGKRNQFRVPSKVRDEESHQCTTDRASHDLSQGVGISVVGDPQCPEIAEPLLLQDYRRWISTLDKHEVEDEPAYPTISVDERVDPFQRGVVLSSMDHRVPFHVLS